MIFFSVHIILSIDKADIYRTFKTETIGTHTQKRCCYCQGFNFGFLVLIRINTNTELRAFLVAQMVKKLPEMQQIQVLSLNWEDPKRMAIHSSILAWRIPWTEATVHEVAESDLTEQLTLSFSGVGEIWICFLFCK